MEKVEQVTASREALDRTYDLLNDAECSHDAHVRFAAYYDESEAEKQALLEATRANDEEIARLKSALQGLLDLSSESGEIDRRLAFKDARKALGASNGEAGQ